MITTKKRDWSGKLFIDGEDAFLKYGIFLLEGEGKNLVSIPQFKKLFTTEWNEHDGMEVDLSDPSLSNRSFQITFGITDVQLANDLFVKMSDFAYHIFSFMDVLPDKPKYLRLSQNNGFTSLLRVGKIKLTLIEDIPNIEREEPYGIGETEVTQRGYTIDDIDLSRFGIWVLQGTDDNLRKCPPVRNALAIDSREYDGVDYDPFNVTFRPKDTAIKCLINTQDVNEFWKRWNALSTILTERGKRVFYAKSTDIKYECYHKSNSVKKFVVTSKGHVWCEFEITLSFIGIGLRPIGQSVLLATEDAETTFVVLEDGVTKIEIRPSFIQ